MIQKGTNDAIVGVVVLIMAILVVLANILVCTLVLTTKRLRTYINGFVVSLAISDTLTAVFAAINFCKRDMRKELFRYFVVFTTISELGNLCAVAYERYIAVVKPFHYKTIIEKNFLGIIVFIWSVSICASLCNFLSLSSIDRSTLRLLNQIFVFIFVVVPFVFMTVMYILIFIEIRKKKRQIQAMQELHSRQMTFRQKREIKIVKMFLVVGGLYAVSWIPAILHETNREIQRFELPGFTTSFAIQIFSLGALTSSLINPFMYTFVKKDFKTQISQIFGKITRRRNVFSRDVSRGIGLRKSAENHSSLQSTHNQQRNRVQTDHLESPPKILTITETLSTQEGEGRAAEINEGRGGAERNEGKVETGSLEEEEDEENRG